MIIDLIFFPACHQTQTAMDQNPVTLVNTKTTGIWMFPQKKHYVISVHCIDGKMWVKQCHFYHPWLGMVTIPPIKMVIFLGDGADGIVLPTFCQFWSIPIRGFSDTRGCAANSHHGVERLHKILGTQKGWDYSALCGQNNAIKHPPVIIILIGGMVTIPKWGGLWLF